MTTTTTKKTPRFKKCDSADYEYMVSIYSHCDLVNDLYHRETSYFKSIMEAKRYIAFHTEQGREANLYIWDGRKDVLIGQTLDGVLEMK